MKHLEWWKLVKQGGCKTWHTQHEKYTSVAKESRFVKIANLTEQETEPEIVIHSEYLEKMNINAQQWNHMEEFERSNHYNIAQTTLRDPKWYSVQHGTIWIGTFDQQMLRMGRDAKQEQARNSVIGVRSRTPMKEDLREWSTCIKNVRIIMKGKIAISQMISVMDIKRQFRIWMNTDKIHITREWKGEKDTV